MKKVAIVAFLTFLPACTYTITLADTHGTASDVVDETSTQDVKPELTVPVQTTL
jgi:hypothetical protein